MTINPVPSNQLREALRTAQRNRDAAKEAVATAQAAVARGKELLALEQKRLADFGDVEADIKIFRTIKYEQAAKSDGRPPCLALPDDLRKRLHGADDARLAVGGATAALNGLVVELKTAETALSRHESIVSDAALEVLLAAALGPGPSLRQRWNELWAAADNLSALSTLVRLPPATVRDLQFLGGIDFRQFAGGTNAAKARMGIAWRAALDALRADADAEVNPPAADEGAAPYQRVA